MRNLKVKQLMGIYSDEIPEFLRKACLAKEIRRLQDVDMFCGMIYSNYSLYRLTHYVSRFDHSLCCALIVWHFTKDKAQTLSALYHDIATPVFSHTIDFMYGDHLRQEYTESRTEEIIENSEEIQSLLKELNLTSADVSDYHRYPIADNDSPKLSADRLEYTLTGMYSYCFTDLETVKALYEDLIVDRNEDGIPELQFQTKENAVRFANLSLRCSNVYISDENRYGMERLAQLVKKAIEHSVLTEEDLWTTESSVITKLKNSDMKYEWADFRKLGIVIRVENEPCDRFSVNTDAKRRFIDPLCKGLGRVTQFNPAYQEAIEEFKKRSLNYYVTMR